jgi:tetratricopeptide (TPR) repeat protein
MKKLIVVICVFIVCTGLSGYEPSRKYLKNDYIGRQTRLVLTENSDLIIKSQKRIDEGVALHQKKKYSEAVAAFESAFDILPLAQCFYHYGNSLSNIGELNNAVQAYLAALHLDYENKAITFYNIACAYSLMNDRTQALIYLRYAVRCGYGNLAYIKKDADLANLRKDPSWEKIYRETERLLRERKTYAGKKLTHAYASSVDEYTFDADGTFVEKIFVSEIKDYVQYGTYKIDGNRVVLHIRSMTGEKGIGEPNRGCASVCTYSEYEAFERSLDEIEIIKTDEVNEYFFPVMSSDAVDVEFPWQIEFVK